MVATNLYERLQNDVKGIISYIKIFTAEVFRRGNPFITACSV